MSVSCLNQDATTPWTDLPHHGGGGSGGNITTNEITSNSINNETSITTGTLSSGTVSANTLNVAVSVNSSEVVSNSIKKFITFHKFAERKDILANNVGILPTDYTEYPVQPNTFDLYPYEVRGLALGVGQTQYIYFSLQGQTNITEVVVLADVYNIFNAGDEKPVARASATTNYINEFGTLVPVIGVKRIAITNNGTVDLVQANLFLVVKVLRPF